MDMPLFKKNLCKQNKFFLTCPCGLTWQVQHSCLFSPPFGIRESMAEERRGKELRDQDKGSSVGKKQIHKTNDLEFAHSTALPPPD